MPGPQRRPVGRRHRRRRRVTSPSGHGPRRWSRARRRSCGSSPRARRSPRRWGRSARWSRSQCPARCARSCWWTRPSTCCAAPPARACPRSTCASSTVSPIGPLAGSCGTAAHERHAVVAEDIVRGPALGRTALRRRRLRPPGVLVDAGVRIQRRPGARDVRGVPPRAAPARRPRPRRSWRWSARWPRSRSSGGRSRTVSRTRRSTTRSPACRTGCSSSSS